MTFRQGLNDNSCPLFIGHVWLAIKSKTREGVIISGITVHRSKCLPRVMTVWQWARVNIVGWQWRENETENEIQIRVIIWFPFFFCTYYDMSQCLLSQIGLRLCIFSCKKEHEVKKRKKVFSHSAGHWLRLNENMVLPFSLQCQVHNTASERTSILDVLFLFNLG